MSDYIHDYDISKYARYMVIIGSRSRPSTPILYSPPIRLHMLVFVISFLALGECSLLNGEIGCLPYWEGYFGRLFYQQLVRSFHPLQFCLKRHGSVLTSVVGVEEAKAWSWYGYPYRWVGIDCSLQWTWDYPSRWTDYCFYWVRVRWSKMRLDID